MKDSKPNNLLLGDSILESLSRYTNIWNKYFAPLNTLNLGIRGDHIKNVLYSSRDISDCTIILGSIFRKKSYCINASVYALVPRDECRSVNRVSKNEVNEILKYQCNINGFGIPPFPLFLFSRQAHHGCAWRENFEISSL